MRFIHISDTHIGPTPDFQVYNENTADRLKTLVDYLNERLPFTPDFVLHTGDITNDWDSESMQLAGEILSRLKYPVYYVGGNHDGRAALRQHLLKQAPSEAPLYYDFVLNDYHFIVLDSHGQPDPQGYISEEQLSWLAERCASSTARSLVLCLHHLPLEIGVPWCDDTEVMGMRIRNADALFATLTPYRDKLRGIFFGHIHRASMGFRDGILCSSVASGFRQFYLWPGEMEPSFDMVSLPGFAIVTLSHDQTYVIHHTLPR